MINVYDFDKTIYKNDSTKDFYFFCIKNNPKILLCLPKQGIAFIKYIFKIYTKTEFKEKFYVFLTKSRNTKKLVEKFWDAKEKNILEYYLKQTKESDIIISASPEFLVKPMMKRLGVNNVLASIVDMKTGTYTGLNCYGKEKVFRFKIAYPNAKINEFYSDSYSDEPLAKLAKKSFIVEGNDISDWEYNRSSLMQKTQKQFINKEFLKFLFVGGINAINGVLFAILYSNIISNANISFILGYITSLIISYILNTSITFKTNYSTKKFIKFVISYIPNFLIQNIVVFLFYNIIGISEVYSYIIAVALGVPVTFLLMKNYAFKGGIYENYNKKIKR